MDVEFIEPSRPKRAHWALLLGLVVLMVLIWVYAFWLTHLIAQRRADLAEARSLAERQRQLESAAASQPARMPYEDDAWHVWRLGRFETLGALRALDSVSHEGISLSSIDIDAEQGDVVIKFKAVSADAMDHYLRDLNSRSQGSQWTISQVLSESVGGIPSGPTTLSVSATSHWNGVMPELRGQ